MVACSILALFLAGAANGLVPPKGGIYEAFTEFDNVLSMYLSLYPEHFKVSLTFKRDNGFFAIAFPVNDNQFRMSEADAFIYGALDGYEESSAAGLREFWLDNHVVEADRRVHYSKVTNIEIKKEDGHINVSFERPNNVDGHGYSMSNYTNELPMLWSHSSVNFYETDDIIRDHGSANRGAVIFSLDGYAHSVTYASNGIVAHTVLSFLAMGILVPLGSLWDRLKFGTCKKFSLMTATFVLFVGVLTGFLSTDEHYTNSHSSLSTGLIGMYGVYAAVQLFRGEKDDKFSLLRMSFDVTLVYGMFILTYFVFTSGVSYLAVSPTVGRGLDILLAMYFAVLCVAVCGPLIHYMRIRSQRYKTVGMDGEGPPSAEDTADTA